ncbi:MAG: hypothetical protein JXJ17_12240 [Anaerolineae bacterium]|nr:hypothetical protein [Anaerolineae bacterium]
MTRKFKRVLLPVLIGVVALALLAAAPVGAAETITGDAITVDEDIEDDLYLFGQTITIDAVVDGDIVAFGSTLTINGTVTGDVLFFGQALVLNGTVEDDVRGAGNTLILEAGSQVGGDLVAAGYAVEMRPGSSVGNDVLAGGGQVQLANVGGDPNLNAGSVRIVGVVGGDADISVSEAGTPMFNPAMFMPSSVGVPQTSTLPGGLTFSDEGMINGDLTYQSESELAVPENQVGGKISFEKIVTEESTPQQQMLRLIRRFAGRFIGSFLALMLVGWLMVRFAPRLVEKPLETLRERWAASLGVGLLAYLAFWFVIFVLFIVMILTLIALSNLKILSRFVGALALLGGGTATLFIFTTRWLALIVVALLIGRWIYKTPTEGKEMLSTVAALAIGLAILTLVLAAPVPGFGLIGLLVSSIGLGAVVLAFWPRKEKDAGEPAKPASGPEADVAPVE